MRLFEYICPVCHYICEQVIPGSEIPPDTIPLLHGGTPPCKQFILKRVWMKIDINYGYRPEKHDQFDQYFFANG